MVDQVKCVVVGDGTVGKTCMLSVFSTNTFPQAYIPTVFDNFSANLLVDNRPACLGLWDTAGQDTYDRLRPLSYPRTDIFMVVFSVVSRVSFNNAASKWVPEIRHHCPEADFMLVGNKTDLRKTDDQQDDKPEGEEALSPVSKQEAQDRAKQLGAVLYRECSALTQDGLTEVFESAVKAVRKPPSKEKPTRFKCRIL